MAKNDHAFMVNGDKEIHLHSPSGKPFALAFDDAGGLNARDETTGNITPVGSGGGSAGGDVVTVIIKQDGYDNIFGGAATASAEPESTYTPSMTYEELMSVFVSGKALTAVYMGLDSSSGTVVHAPSVMCAVRPDNVVCMAFAADGTPSVLYWVPWGITTTDPLAST